MTMFVPKDRKSLFRQYLAGMYDAVVITDPNGHIIEINPRAVEFFGYQEEEVADQKIALYFPGLAPEVVLRVRKGLAENRHLVIDVNGRTKAGEKLACEVTVSMIDLMDPQDLVFTIRNVERRRALMNQLRAKANAFDIATVGLFGCDTEGRIRDCNAAFLELFGLKDIEDARTHTFEDLMGDAPLPENFRKALAGKRTVTGLMAQAEDGETELEITLAPNQHAHKNHGVVGCIEKAS